MALTRNPPQGRFQIDWADPLTSGLAFLFVLGGSVAYGVTGEKQPVVAVPYYMAAQQATPLGLGSKASNSQQRILNTGATPLTNNTYSLFAHATGSPSVTQIAIDDDSLSTGRRFQFRMQAGKAEFIPFANSSTTTGQVISPVALTAQEMLGRGFTMGAVATPSLASVYQNGVRTSAATSGGTPYPPLGDFWIGCRKTNSTIAQAAAWLIGGMHVVMGWNRALTDDEMMRLADDPYTFIIDQGEDYYALYATIISLQAAPAEVVLAGSGSTVARTASTGAIAQHHGLAASGAVVARSSGTGAVGQHHEIAAADIAVSRTSANGAVGQRHSVVGAAASLARTSSTGAAAQHHTLAGASISTARASGSGAVGQHHELTGATASVARASSTGSLNVTETRYTLAGVLTTLGRTSSTGAAAQHHTLAGAGSILARASGSGAVGQRNILAAASTSTARSSSTGVLVQRSKLAASPSYVYRSLTGGALVQHHKVAGGSTSIQRGSQAGHIGQTHELKAAQSFMTRISRSVQIRKVVLILSSAHIYVVPEENRVFQVPEERRILSI
jgi:hypothetical protein